MEPRDPHPEDLHIKYKGDICGLYMYYFDYYTNKYGHGNTFIFMQVGGFWEFYGVDNSSTKKGMVFEWATMLGVDVTCRGGGHIKSNHQRNPLMAGIPLNALSRYVNILTGKNYTVVTIEQVKKDKEDEEDDSDEATESPEKKDKKLSKQENLPRRVGAIYSPGTVFFSQTGFENNDDNKYLVQIYIEGYKATKISGPNPRYQPLCVGLSAIDVTTGHSDVYEAYNTEDDANFALDEIYRYIQTHQPKELLITTNGLNMSEHELEAYLDLKGGDGQLKYQLVHNAIKSQYLKDSYQRQFLEKVFPDRKNMLNVFEYLNLSRTMTARISYILLLQFTYEHNEAVIRNLQKPEHWEDVRHLLLANNAINQLDLINRNTKINGSVVNLMGQTTTGMGKRLFRQRMLGPIMNRDILEQRYNLVELFRTDDYWKKVQDSLKCIYDLDRLHRQIAMQELGPKNLHILRECYTPVMELIDLAPPELLPSPDFAARMQAYMDFLDSTVDWDEACKYKLASDMIDNVFVVGYDAGLDKISDVIRRHQNYIDVMAQKLSDTVILGQSKGKKKKPSQGALVVHKKYTEASGYYFEVTKIRLAALNAQLEQTPLDYQTEGRKFVINRELPEQKKGAPPPPELPHRLRVIWTNKDKSKHNLKTDDLEDISNVLTDSEKELKKAIIRVYEQYLQKLSQQYEELYQQMSHFVAEMDFYKAAAKVSLQYNYCRPELVESKSSFVRAIQMRHPLVEVNNEDSIYVPHDLQFGTHEDSPEYPNLPTFNGLLLYGTNSCGKSTLMKAVGINVILAQAGLYVAADQFQYAPYGQVLTRILGNDNLFKSLSSFAVEMTELRGILARSGKRSLILGDEVCRGTETNSGVALMASSLVDFVETKSHFVFATHFHQLLELSAISDLQEQGLGIYHLAVHRDPVKHLLVYDRKLHPGSGDPLYGIEVARAMDLPAKFLERANMFRQQLASQSEEILSTQASRYNAQRFANDCEICGQAMEDWHHIMFQCTADQKGFIGHVHKNHGRNLVPLCKPCHQRVHAGYYKINGYKVTSEGIVLDYEEKKVDLTTPKTKVVFKKVATTPKKRLNLQIRKA